MFKFISKLWKRKVVESKVTKKTVTIREGVLSVWHYHLAENGKVLCNRGGTTIPTNLPLDTWGMVSPHIHETYCKKCDKIGREKGII